MLSPGLPRAVAAAQAARLPLQVQSFFPPSMAPVFSPPSLPLSAFLLLAAQPSPARLPSFLLLWPVASSPFLPSVFPCPPFGVLPHLPRRCKRSGLPHLPCRLPGRNSR